MRASRLAVAFAVMSFAGAARAQSALPGNYVDDFGPVASSVAASDQLQKPTSPAHASPIAANQIDDFAPVATDGVAAPAVARTAHASAIPSNYVDDFGVDGASSRGRSVAIAARR